MKQKVLKNGAVCWECDQRRNKFACKTKLPILDDQLIKVTNDHTHAVNKGKVQALKVRQEMKKCARISGKKNYLPINIEWSIFINFRSSWSFS